MQLRFEGAALHLRCHQVHAAEHLVREVLPIGSPPKHLARPATHRKGLRHPADFAFLADIAADKGTVR